MVFVEIVILSFEFMIIPPPPPTLQNLVPYLVYLTSKIQVKSSLGNRPRKDVYQLQMNPLETIPILKRNLNLITQMTYY